MSLVVLSGNKFRNWWTISGTTRVTSKGEGGISICLRRLCPYFLLPVRTLTPSGIFSFARKPMCLKGSGSQPSFPPPLNPGQGLIWWGVISAPYKWLVQKWPCDPLGQQGKRRGFFGSLWGKYPCSSENAMRRAALDITILGCEANCYSCLSTRLSMRLQVGRQQSWENCKEMEWEPQDLKYIYPKPSSTSGLGFCELDCVLFYKPVWVFCCLQIKESELIQVVKN